MGSFGDAGKGFGMLGQSGSGKVRVAAKDTKVLAKAHKLLNKGTPTLSCIAFTKMTLEWKRRLRRHQDSAHGVRAHHEFGVYTCAGSGAREPSATAACTGRRGERKVRVSHALFCGGLSLTFVFP